MKKIKFKLVFVLLMSIFLLSNCSKDNAPDSRDIFVGIYTMGSNSLQIWTGNSSDSFNLNFSGSSFYGVKEKRGENFTSNGFRITDPSSGAYLGDATLSGNTLTIKYQNGSKIEVWTK